MPNDKRRRKKNEKRGRVAAPKIQRESSGQVSPGVPSFQGGGAIQTQDEPWWRRVQQGQGAGGGGLFPGIEAFEDWLPEDYQTMQAAIQLGQQLGISPQEASNLLQYPTWMQKEMVGAGTTGGGGTYHPPAWRPGEFGLEQQAQQIQQQMAQLDAQIAREGMELERAIADQNATLARQHETNITRLQEGRLSLDQMRTQIEASLGQQGIYAGERGMDIQQRGQDIQAELEFINAQIRQDAILRQDAIDRGNLQLQTEIENRMRANMEQQNLLQQRQQDIQVRGQDIDTQLTLNQQGLQEAQSQRDYAISIGDQNLQRDAEERIRAHQKQQVALQQYTAQLQGAGLGIEAQRGAGTQMGQLAQGLGDIEARRHEMLSRTQANPRDWMQYMSAVGESGNFLNQLMSGQPIGAQSAAGIGTTPLLGEGYDRLTREITQRRDLPLFGEAADMARRLAQMGENVPQAPGLQQLLQLGQMPGVSAPPPPTTPTQITPPSVGRPPSVIGGGAEAITDWVNADPRLAGGYTGAADITKWVQSYPGGAGGGGPTPQLAPAIPAPKLDFTLPGQVGREGPGSVLSPDTRAIYEQFMGAAPETPVDIGMNIARNPQQAREYFATMAGGGKLVTDEPIVGMGMHSGMPKFTLGEATAEHPEGVKELMEITPMQQGGTVAARTGHYIPPTPEETRRRKEVLQRAGGWGAQQVQAPKLDRAPLRQTPLGTVGGPGFQLPKPAPGPPQQPWTGYRSGPYRPPLGTVGGPGYTPQPQLPVAKQPYQPPRQPVPGQLYQAPPPTPIQNIQRQPPAPPRRTPGQFLFNMGRALPPRSYYGMLPSQKALSSSIVSAFGMPPADFWASLERSFPGGVNPGMIQSASF